MAAGRGEATVAVDDQVARLHVQPEGRGSQQQGEAAAQERRSLQGLAHPVSQSREPGTPNMEAPRGSLG
jgi:hypothetical protein